MSGRVQGVLSRCVDLRSLKLEGEGGKAWLVGLKSVCLSLDGGLFDAALASCVAALSSLRLPGEVREVVGGGEGRESSEAVVEMEEGEPGATLEYQWSISATEDSESRPIDRGRNKDSLSLSLNECGRAVVCECTPVAANGVRGIACMAQSAIIAEVHRTLTLTPS